MAVTTDTSALQELIDKARAIDSPHVDLAPLFGLSSPVKLGVDDLHNCILEQKLPDAVSLHFDGDKTITVSHIDGGVLATFEMPF